MVDRLHGIAIRTEVDCGDGEPDAVAVELIEDESFLTFFWVTYQGGIAESSATWFIDQVSHPTRYAQTERAKAQAHQHDRALTHRYVGSLYSQPGALVGPESARSRSPGLPRRKKRVPPASPQR